MVIRVVSSLVRRSELVSGLVARAPLRAAWRQSLPLVGTFTVPVPGGRAIRWSLSPEDGVGRSAVLRGGRGHEPETMEHFVRLAREASGTIFDIGANTGLFALVAASVNPEVSVHAFEAVPRTFERLVANVGLNPGLDVTAHPDAVARQSGTARLFVPHTGLPLDASLLAGYRDDVDVVEVTAVSVDDFVSVNRIERVALMKIDVEGTEDDVIAGALRTINRDRPTLICELLPARPPAERVPPLLRPLGYRFFHLRGSGAVEVTGPIAGYEGRDYNFLIRPP